jgi:hypothetical protein
VRDAIVSTDINKLPEVGEAIWVDKHGDVRAVFYDGNIVHVGLKFLGNSEVTASV